MYSNAMLGNSMMGPSTGNGAGFDINGMMMGMMGMSTVKDIMSTTNDKNATFKEKAFAILMLLFIGLMSSFLPVVTQFAQRQFNILTDRYFNQQQLLHQLETHVSQVLTKLDGEDNADDETARRIPKEPRHKPVLSEIKLTFAKRNGQIPTFVEALNAHICSLDSALILEYDGTFLVGNPNSFLVCESSQIWCKVIRRSFSKLLHTGGDDGSGGSGNNHQQHHRGGGGGGGGNGSGSSGSSSSGGNGEKDGSKDFDIVVYSYQLNASELKSFLETLEKKFVAEKGNLFGRRLFYFNEITAMQDYAVFEMQNKNPATRGIQSPLNRACFEFSMNEFIATKRLDNIFGAHLDPLKKRLDMFKNKPEWYMKHGIPRRLGIMLYGPPGTGKTSLIKAIANSLHLHIFNMSITPQTTETQLFELFHNPLVSVRNKNGQATTFNIPSLDRLLVFEDIDALTTTFHSRADSASAGKKTTGDNALTLSAFLNLIDGVLETNTIEIYTTNDPSKLDPALIRSGRIDFLICVGYCDVDMIHTMLHRYYDIPKDKAIEHFAPFVSQYQHNRTPADVQNAFLSNIDDIQGCIQHFMSNERDVFSKQNFVKPATPTTSTTSDGKPQEQEPISLLSVPPPLNNKNGPDDFVSVQNAKSMFMGVNSKHADSSSSAGPSAANSGSSSLFGGSWH